MLTRDFRAMRARVARLQRVCRGYIVRRGCGMKLRAVVLLQAQVRMKQQRGRYRKLLAHHRRMKEAEERRQREEEELKKKMKAEEAKKEAERKQQEYLAYLEMQAREEEERERLETERKKEELKKIEERHDRDREEVPDDSQVVEDIFGFLGGEAGGQPGYVVSEHLGGDESHLPLPAVEIEEDITVYKFSKFAATYFQGAATHSWIHRQLKQPLLPLKLDHDRQAALAIWTVIRRFMGDLPEPKVTQQADKKAGEGLGKTPVPVHWEGVQPQEAEHQHTGAADAGGGADG